MSDLISRQATIDWLKNEWDGMVTSVFNGIESLPSAQPERLTDDDFETIRIHLSAYKEKLCNQRRWKEAEEYQRIIDRFMSFASAQPEQQWIPCSERLPEEMTYVLVTDKDGDVYSVKFIEVIDGQAEWVFDNGIIAWMPLPEPYDPLTGHMNPPEE